MQVAKNRTSAVQYVCRLNNISDQHTSICIYSGVHIHDVDSTVVITYSGVFNIWLCCAVSFEMGFFLNILFPKIKKI